jgi:putative transposase
MPRRPRLIHPGIPLHIIQRGNNRQACFFADEDYLFYLDWLHEYAQEVDCAIHAFILMTNHVHILLTPAKENSAGELMKRLGQHYVQNMMPYGQEKANPANIGTLYDNSLNKVPYCKKSY